MTEDEENQIRARLAAMSEEERERIRAELLAVLGENSRISADIDRLKADMAQRDVERDQKQVEREQQLAERARRRAEREDFSRADRATEGDRIEMAKLLNLDSAYRVVPWGWNPPQVGLDGRARTAGARAVKT